MTTPTPPDDDKLTFNTRLEADTVTARYFADLAGRLAKQLDDTHTQFLDHLNTSKAHQRRALTKARWRFAHALALWVTVLTLLIVDTAVDRAWLSDDARLLVGVWLALSIVLEVAEWAQGRLSKRRAEPG